MEYIMAEFDKMKINLDRMLSAQQTGEAQNNQQGNEEGETIAAEIGDPQTKKMIQKEFREREDHLNLLE